MPKRLLIATLLAAVLVGCGQGPAPTGQPASSSRRRGCRQVPNPIGRSERRARGHAHPNSRRNTDAGRDAFTDANADPGTVAGLQVEEAALLDEVPARLGRHPGNDRLSRPVRRPRVRVRLRRPLPRPRRLRRGTRENGEGGDCLLQEPLRRKGAVQQEGQGRGLERSAGQDDGQGRWPADLFPVAAAGQRSEWITASTGNPTATIARPTRRCSSACTGASKPRS